MHGVDTHPRPSANHDSVRVLDPLDHLGRNQWAELLRGFCCDRREDQRERLCVMRDVSGKEKREYDAHIRIGMDSKPFIYCLEGKSGGGVTWKGEESCGDTRKRDGIDGPQLRVISNGDRLRAAVTPTSSATSRQLV